MHLDQLALPAGLSARHVATLIERQTTEQWWKTKEYFEERVADSELDYVAFLRWCLHDLPSVPLPLWLNFILLRGLVDCPHAQRRALSYDEIVSVVSRLDLDVTVAGLWEVQLLDEIVSALSHDFAPFRTVVRERLGTRAWSVEQCRLFLLVDWLLGSTLSTEECAAAGHLCAQAHALSKERDRFCVLEPLRRRTEVAECSARGLGVALLGESGWVAALAADLEAKPHWRLYQFLDVFERRPLEPLVHELASRGDPVDDLTAYARRRREPAAELLRVGGLLRPTPLGELLVLEGIARLLDAGEALPRPAAELLSVDLVDRAAVARYAEVLPRLSPDERAALLDRRLGIVALAPTDDDAPLRTLLRGPAFEPLAIGALGRRAIDALLARLDEPCDAATRKRLEDVLLEAIATHLVRGGTFDDNWHIYVVLGSLSSDAGRVILRCLPEPQRAALLVEAVREAHDIVGVLSAASDARLSDAGARAFIAASRARSSVAFPRIFHGNLAELNDDPRSPEAIILPALERLRERAAAAPGPHEPVYMMQIVDDEIAARATTLTSLGGHPPVAPARRPRGLVHVLTVDFEDAPEVASRFPGAVAASLFVPRSARSQDESDDELDIFSLYEDSCWRAWSEADVAAARKKKRSRTLVLHRVLLPSAMFAETRFPRPELASVREALSAFEGWLLGGPLVIQEDTRATRSDDFMGQLTEAFDLNLGDAGNLYSYIEGALWDCH
ncbi:MAG: hypothetical protein SFX73_09915 [Kofleriaceae bacterium]|nr:hypothetical protein [Kofleriaceae bacterium]